jgi:RNA processing factor Prp31
MRIDGKSPAPAWLRGLDELEERVARLEELASKPAPSKPAPSKPAPKKAEPKKPAPKKPAPKKASAKKK